MTATLPAHSTRREDLITTTLSVWLVVGLLIDSFNHVVSPELETFWTPWHAIFYSGFTATAVWIVRVGLRRRQPEGGILGWAPPGYRWSIIGVGIFAAGGVADAIWHTVLGVETSLDALLSPSHLMLWVGGLLMLSTGVRVAWLTDEPDAERDYRDFLPVTASLALTILIMAFFYIYAWNLTNPGVLRSVYEPTATYDGNSEVVAALGVLGVLVQTVILIVPALMMRRRWRMPMWTMTTVFGVIGVGMTLGFDGEWLGVPSLLLAGFVFDATARRRDLLAPIATPAVLFGAYFATIAATGAGIGWPPELWSGSIVLAAMAMTAFELILNTANTTGSLHGTP